MPKKTAPLKDKSSEEKVQSPGEILKKERLLQKKSLHTIATQLCINERYLESIEEMRLSDLPERVYTLGFINTYALYLGLDPKPFLEGYGKRLEVETVYHSPICHEIAPKIRPKWYHFLVALGALLLAFFIWQLLSMNPSHPSTTLVPEEAEGTTDPSPVQVTERLETPTSAPMDPFLDQGDPQGTSSAEHDSVPSWTSEAPPPPQDVDADAPFILKAKEKVWLEIRDADHHVLYTKTLLPGEEYTYTPSVPSTLTTGNAGGLEIRKGNNVFKPLGASGEVKRNIPLKAGAQEAKTEGLVLSLE